jgi:CubicO group peptidase (beta-lactamase class C family)
VLKAAIGRKTTPATAAALLALATLLNSCASSEDDGRIPQRFKPLAEAVEQERGALGATGVAVAIVERGEVTFARGFGAKSATGTEPVQATTLFRIGSSGKMLTALGVLKAVESGRLDLDDPVIRHVPAFHLNRTPDAVAGIRVRHLLSHTSGLADYAETAAPANERTEAALEGFLTGRYADIGYVASPPGAVFAYSNPGFELAGLVAQKATGMPFRTLMRETVFAPLGMNRTYFLAQEVLADGDYAVGAHCTATDPQCSEPELGPVVRPDSYDNPWSWPAGFEWSSVLDMARLGRLLTQGDRRVLNEDLRRSMLSAQVSTKECGDVVGYGFGVFLSRGQGVPDPSTGAQRWYTMPVANHDGDIPGFASTFFCLPEQQFCFIALANASNAHFNNSLLVALQTLADLPSPGTLPNVAPRPERYPLYAGAYVDPFEVGRIEVTTDGSKLLIEIPALDASSTPYGRELAPTAIDNFNLTIAGQEPRALTFIADSTGVYRYLRSRPYLAVRVSP